MRKLKNQSLSCQVSKDSLQPSFHDISSGLGRLYVLNGRGKTSDTLELLTTSPNQKVAWIEPVITLNPVAITQMGLNVSRFTFFECGHDAEWVALEVLNSGLFPILILAVEKTLPEYFLNQLQKTVGQTRTTVLVISSRSSGAFTSPLRRETQEAAKTLAVSNF